MSPACMQAVPGWALGTSRNASRHSTRFIENIRSKWRPWTDRPRRSICGRSRGGPPVLLRRLLAIVLVSVSVVGCNAILGNDDHDYSPDLDATVDGAPEHAPDASVDAGLREAASGSDARGGNDGGSAGLDGSAPADSSPGPGSDGGEVTQEAGTIVATCTTDGGACKPATDCHAGALTCANGGETCAATTALADGTACGTDAVHFCSKGVCGQCAAGADCSSTSALDRRTVTPLATKQNVPTTSGSRALPSIGRTCLPASPSPEA